MSETALIFLLSYFFGLGLALFVRPVYGLYTYVAVFYLHPPSRWWGSFLPDLRWSLTAALVTLFAILIHRQSIGKGKPWYRSSIVMILALYTLWMWVQVPWASSTYHLEGTVLFSKYTLLAFLMYTLLYNERDFRGFCIAHVLGCAFFGYLIFVAPDSGRLEGVGGPGVDNANTLGMHLATGLLFASFLILATRGILRWLVAATIPFILNGIIQTETRGAVVGLFVGALATFFLKPRKYRRAYYGLAVLALAGMIFLANEAFLGRMHSMIAAVDKEQEWDTSAASRLVLVKSQLEMFQDYPLGAGHQGTAYLSRKYIDERWLAHDSGDRASHNTVMSVLVDQGVIGIVLFVILGVVVTRILRQLKAMDTRGLPDELGLYRTMLGGALCTIIGAGMFAQYLKAEVQIWCLVLLAALWDLARDYRPAVALKSPSGPVPTVSRAGDGPACLQDCILEATQPEK